MKLKVEQKKHQDKILGMLEDSKTSVIEMDEHGIYIDDYISYDEMAGIVDYIRTIDTKDDLFEKCWLAYNRKGSKKKSKEYWNKLSDTDKENVLTHIKAYVASRELQFQKDFERYLRDKVFQTVVYQGNSIIYDPTKLGKGETVSFIYMPSGNFSISWDESLQAYLYIGFYSEGMRIADGYDDDNRPDGAKIVLNNGRGTIIWSSNKKKWEKK